MSAHTPGPWHWVIQDHSMATLGVGQDPGMGDPHVLSVSPCGSCAERHKEGEWKWGRCLTPSEADARLIAAAPELLEALIRVFEDCQVCVVHISPSNPIEQARAAIAKATGEPA